MWPPPLMRGRVGLSSLRLASSACDSASTTDTIGFHKADTCLHGPFVVSAPRLHATSKGVDPPIGPIQHPSVLYANCAPLSSVQGMDTYIPAQISGLIVKCVQKEDILNKHPVLPFGVLNTKVTRGADASYKEPLPTLKWGQVTLITKPTRRSSVTVCCRNQNLVSGKGGDIWATCYNMGLYFLNFGFEIRFRTFRAMLFILRCMTFTLNYVAALMV